MDIDDASRFLGSVCRLAPSTIGANATASENEGAGDLTVMYATPMLVNLFSSDADFILKRKYYDFSTADENYTPLPYRMVHNYRIPIPGVCGLESGQVAAEGMLTRGFECWWRPFTYCPPAADAAAGSPSSLHDGMRPRTYNPYYFSNRGSEDELTDASSRDALQKHYGQSVLFPAQGRDPNSIGSYPLMSRLNSNAYPLT